MTTDQQMRAVLLELTLLMHGSTTSWSPTTSGDRDRDPRPSGDSYPPAEEYRDHYQHAHGELARRRILKAARDELDRWRGHGTQRHAGETQEQLDKRILRDGKDFDPQTVAVRFDTNAGRIRKLRIANGHHPETGKPLPDAKANKIETPERVIELSLQGCTLRQIETLTGVPRMTVSRMLGRAA